MSETAPIAATASEAVTGGDPVRRPSATPAVSASPFTLVGDAAPACVDGVCELPPR